MSTYSPSGLEHAKSIQRDLRHAVRDDFEPERGFRNDHYRSTLKLKLLDKAVHRDVSAGLAPEPPAPAEQTDAEYWEAHRANEDHG